MNEHERSSLRCPMCERHHALDGYVLCGVCCYALEADLDEVAERYARLDATPGRGNPGDRGAPGFHSQPPGSVHVMTMRDVRSSERMGTWDDNETSERRPPRSVQRVLLGLALRVRAGRGLSQPPPRHVEGLAVWLGRHVDWLARDELGGEAAREVRSLRAQLRQATGEPAPTPVGHCLVDGCGAPIFMPESLPRAPDEPIQTMPTLTCSRCGDRYDGRRLILLRLAEEAAA